VTLEENKNCIKNEFHDTVLVISLVYKCSAFVESQGSSLSTQNPASPGFPTGEAIAQHFINRQARQRNES
jgi:hypothetical protein